MQVQNINSTSFNGGYKFIRMPKGTREELPDIIKKGKTIYENFEGKQSNVFMVTKDCFHDIVAAFVLKHNLNCKYYPDVKPEMNFKLGHPEKASEVIKNMTPVNIEFNDKLLTQIRTREINTKSNDYIRNILKALCIDETQCKTKMKKGAKIIDDNNGKNRVIISPPNELGIHYVRLEPKISTSDSAARRLAMTSSGEILKEFSVDNAMQFLKRFNDTLLNTN